MAKHRSSSYSSMADLVLLQPWFLPKRVASAIHGLVPHGYWRKWRDFFDDYGCLICGSESRYHSNGMCLTCSMRTRKKLAQSVKRRLKTKLKRPLGLELFRQQKFAKKLLGRYCRRGKPSSQVPGTCEVRRTNPVYEALSALPR